VSIFVTVDHAGCRCGFFSSPHRAFDDLSGMRILEQKLGARNAAGHEGISGSEVERSETKVRGRSVASRSLATIVPRADNVTVGVVWLAARSNIVGSDCILKALSVVDMQAGRRRTSGVRLRSGVD
jgi:hypothetical protein